MALAEQIDTLRERWDNLTDRERRLLMILGGLLAVLVIGLPLYLINSSIASVSDENEEISTLLNDISTAEAQLQQRAADRLAAKRRYARRVPGLREFLSSRATEVGLSVDDVTNQPDKEIGDFTQRSVRVSLPRVQLRPAIELLARIKDSGYPISIDSIDIQHQTLGEDQFHIRLDISTYERKGGATDENDEEGASRSGRRRVRAGPPTP